MGKDDASLLAACREGDQRAWRQLVDRYVRLVHAIARNIGLGPADAEDVTQMTFAALASGLDAITEEDRLGAWIATVARRQAWRVIERRRRDVPADHEELQLQRPDPGEEAAVVRRVEELEWVHQGLGRLDERCRDLLLALYFTTSARPYSEVAAQLGIPVGSIGPTRARCLEKLRGHLEELAGP